MDGILNILIILGFVGFAIYRSIGKIGEDKTTDQPPVPYGMDEVFPEVPYSPAPEAPIVWKQKKKKTNPESRNTYQNSEPGEVNHMPLEEEENVGSDIDTQSIDEIRKGIIWSEILNRKY